MLVSFQLINFNYYTLNQYLIKIHSHTLMMSIGGTMPIPYTTSQDGNEMQFQVNYLGPFLLMNLLLPKMSKIAEDLGSTGKIVNVSSAVQYYGKIDFSNLDGRL